MDLPQLFYMNLILLCILFLSQFINIDCQPGIAGTCYVAQTCCCICTPITSGCRNYDCSQKPLCATGRYGLGASCPCLLCPPGKFSNQTGFSVCRDVDIGYRSSSGSNPGATNQIACAPGYYSSLTGATVCTQVPPNFKANAPLAATDIIACLSGTYSLAGSTECYPVPTSQPSIKPSRQPLNDPTQLPSAQPVNRPTKCPTKQPYGRPSRQPSQRPSSQPSCQPSRLPSSKPSLIPSGQPMSQPSGIPSLQPFSVPSSHPSRQPSNQPTASPSLQPTSVPSKQPNFRPSIQPTTQPSVHPSNQPTSSPSMIPSSLPSTQPSSMPSTQPSTQPTSRPSKQPSSSPSISPTRQPSVKPTRQPNMKPSNQPSNQPSIYPTNQPSARPSRLPTNQPSRIPTIQPSGRPSVIPTCQPSNRPSVQPSLRPSTYPTYKQGTVSRDSVDMVKYNRAGRDAPVSYLFTNLGMPINRNKLFIRITVTFTVCTLNSGAYLNVTVSPPDSERGVTVVCPQVDKSSSCTAIAIDCALNLDVTSLVGEPYGGSLLVTAKLSGLFDIKNVQCPLDNDPLKYTKDFEIKARVTSQPWSTLPPSNQEESEGLSTGIICAIAIGGGCLLLCICLAIALLLSRLNLKNKTSPSSASADSAERKSDGYKSVVPITQELHVKTSAPSSNTYPISMQEAYSTQSAAITKGTVHPIASPLRPNTANEVAQHTGDPAIRPMTGGSYTWQGSDAVENFNGSQGFPSRPTTVGGSPWPDGYPPTPMYPPPWGGAFHPSYGFYGYSVPYGGYGIDDHDPNLSDVENDGLDDASSGIYESDNSFEGPHGASLFNGEGRSARKDRGVS